MQISIQSPGGETVIEQLLMFINKLNTVLIYS